MNYINIIIHNLYTRLIELADFFYAQYIKIHLKGINSVLDLGCGSNSPLGKIKKTFYSVGVDTHKPSITISKRNKIHNRYIIGNIIPLENLLPKKKFDAVIMLEVIEHMNKRTGKRLLKAIEKIAKKKIIIITTNGYTYQESYDNNPYQEHKSGWTVKDFTKMGYKVRGIRGFKFIRGKGTRIQYKPEVLWGIIALLSHFLLYYFPSLSYQILAIKEINNKIINKDVKIEKEYLL